MRFKDAVEATPHLAGQWQPGLQALRAEDRPHVLPSDPRKLRGSVDVDTALKKLPAQAEAHRWDFAIGFQHTNRAAEFVYWVETHTGNDSQISVMMDKLAWLKQWLAGDGKPLAGFECDFVWAPSGATSFTKGARQVRALAGMGLRYTGSGLKIPDAHPKTEQRA